MKTEHKILDGKKVVIFIGGNTSPRRELQEEIIKVLDNHPMKEINSIELNLVPDYRLVNPVEPFTDTFVVSGDILLMDKSTGLFWGEYGWTNDLRKVVRAESKTELRKLIPWYGYKVKEYYRTKYYIEKGIPLKEGMVTSEVIHSWQIMYQRRLVEVGELL